MPCYKPMIRTEYYNGKIVLEGSIENDIARYEKINSLWKSPNIKRVDQIPCGKCIGCRLEYSREWANRMMLEAKCYPKNETWFLTLTYDEFNVPWCKGMDIDTGEIKLNQTLKKKDLQDFMKRLRKHYEPKKIRFYGAGEYGSTTNRPHYHLIIYGLPLDIRGMKKLKNNKFGDPIYECEELTKVWGKGFVSVAQCTWETAAYCARYVMKKQYGPEAKVYYQAQGIQPEFVDMSRNIGKEYYENHKDEIYKNDEITLPRKGGAIKSNPPKFFDQMLKEEDRSLYDKIKHARARKNDAHTQNIYQQTTLTPWEIRSKDEELKTIKSKQLVREL